jgi:hypothetical protein
MASSKPTLDWIKRVLSDPGDFEKRSGQLQESWHEPSLAGHGADLMYSIHPVVESRSLAREVDA